MKIRGPRLGQILGVLHTSTFRYAFLASAMFGLGVLGLFGLVYTQAVSNESAGIDRTLRADIDAILDDDLSFFDELNQTMAPSSASGSYVELFGADGRPMLGDIPVLPTDVPLDRQPHATAIPAPMPGSPRIELHAIAARLPDGRILMLARTVRQVAELRQAVIRTLVLGVLPVMMLALLSGLWLGWRAGRRVREITLSIERIMRGDLSDRVPMTAAGERGAGDAFDKLAVSVNHMLDEIERLLETIRGIGNDIAHDLRTPLTRVRTRLELSARRAESAAELNAALDAATAGLDQALAIGSALLRIGEIEEGRRRAGFRTVDLSVLVRDLAEMYEPVATERSLGLTVMAPAEIQVYGDPELLMEAFANILDNALKFTPAGGRIELAAKVRGAHGIVQISDTGPGIPPGEREAVLRRFYRADKSRNMPGSGLGLGLVSAVITLHGFALTISDAEPGCVFEIAAPLAVAAVLAAR